MSESDLPHRPRVGISQCLLGDPVRYDGRDQRSSLCADLLAPHLDFVAVCPEMGIGMGTPRPPIHLVGALRNDAVRALGRQNPTLDVTKALTQFARSKADALDGLCGYVFMARSPSCGLGPLPLHSADGQRVARRGAGLFAREFRRRHPLLPVAEAARLQNPMQLDSFLTRVYAWRRWQELLATGLTTASLRDFHARHKLLLLARRPASWRHLGRLLASAGQRPLEALARDYLRVFMRTLELPADREGHSRVLRTMAGFLRQRLDDSGRAALARAIADYRQGRLARAVPLALLRQQLHAHAYLERQAYLQPYPAELLSADLP